MQGRGRAKFFLSPNMIANKNKNKNFNENFINT